MSAKLTEDKYKQKNRWTDRKMDGLTDRQMDRPSGCLKLDDFQLAEDCQTERQTSQWIDSMTDRRQTDRQVDRQKGRQTGRWTGRQTNRWTDRLTDRQTDGQTDKVPDWMTSKLAGLSDRKTDKPMD